MSNKGSIQIQYLSTISACLLDRRGIAFNHSITFYIKHLLYSRNYYNYFDILINKTDKNTRPYVSLCIASFFIMKQGFQKVFPVLNPLVLWKPQFPPSILERNFDAILFIPSSHFSIFVQYYMWLYRFLTNLLVALNKLHR